MQRSLRIMLVAALLVALSVFGTAQPVAAGCAINVTYVNKDATIAKVDQVNSKVKSKQAGVWGLWTKLGTTTLSVPAHGSKVKTYNLALGCGVSRRYKFVVKNGGNTKTIYKPSATGSTTAINITVNIDF
jgi:hypothetical protein